jgi:acyl-CoA reductase-like NAD-dependent aldehyde dehydrogenase
MRLSRKLQFGTVWVNTHIFTASRMPFGGYGESGIGRELTAHGIDEYSQLKHVMGKADLTA